jgi:hypothetical protein
MKKLLTIAVIALLTVGVCLRAREPLPEYDGPPDDTPWTGTSVYDYLGLHTNLGRLSIVFAIDIETLRDVLPQRGYT